VNLRAPSIMLILGMIRVVKLCCCCAKTHVRLYRISVYEILA